MLTVREVLNVIRERIAIASDEQRKAKCMRKTVHVHPMSVEWAKELMLTKYGLHTYGRADYISALLAFHHEIRGHETCQNHERKDSCYVYYRELDRLREEFSDTLALVWTSKAA
jgi:hypothetical protein